MCTPRNDWEWLYVWPTRSTRVRLVRTIIASTKGEARHQAHWGHLYCTSGVTTSDEQPISTGLTTFYRGRLTLQTSLALPLAWTIECKPSMVIGGSEARHTQVKGTWRYNVIWLSVPCPFLLFNLCLYIPPNINDTKRNIRAVISFNSLSMQKQNELTN